LKIEIGFRRIATVEVSSLWMGKMEKVEERKGRKKQILIGRLTRLPFDAVQ